MDELKVLEKHQVVRSIKGRDMGNVFIILEIINESYVLIVDGKKRKLIKPKKKKIKHLQKFNKVLSFGEELTDSLIRKTIKSFLEE